MAGVKALGLREFLFCRLPEPVLTAMISFRELVVSNLSQEVSRNWQMRFDGPRTWIRSRASYADE
jgi:hypothetical protein